MATVAETTATVPRLEIADLGLDENDIDFSDGVACVTTYWSYALTMTVADRHLFCKKVQDKRVWAHSNTSRGQPSGHRIYRSLLGKSVVGYLFLMALYKELPDDYVKRLKAQPGVVLPGPDRTEEYLQLHGNIAKPPEFDFDTPEARDYITTNSTLRNIPSIYRKKAAVPTPPAPPVAAPTVPKPSKKKKSKTAAATAPAATAAATAITLANAVPPPIPPAPPAVYTTTAAPTTAPAAPTTAPAAPTTAPAAPTTAPAVATTAPAVATTAPAVSQQKAQKTKSSSKNQTSNKEKSNQKPHTGVKTAVTQAAPLPAAATAAVEDNSEAILVPDSPESDQDPFHNDPDANLQNNPRQWRSPPPQTALPSTGPTPLAFTRQDLSPNAYQAPPTTTQDQRRTFTQAFGSDDHYSQAHGNPWQRHVNTPTRVGMVTPTRQERDTPFQRPISSFQGGSAAVSPFGFTGLADVPQSSLFTYGSMSQRRVDVQAPIYRQSQRIPMSQNSTNRNVEAELRDEIAILREESASLREENASLREVMAGMDERQAAAAGDIAALWRELRRRR